MCQHESSAPSIYSILNIVINLCVHYVWSGHYDGHSCMPHLGIWPSSWGPKCKNCCRYLMIFLLIFFAFSVLACIVWFILGIRDVEDVIRRMEWNHVLCAYKTVLTLLVNWYPVLLCPNVCLYIHMHVLSMINYYFDNKQDKNLCFHSNKRLSKLIHSWYCTRICVDYHMSMIRF